VPEPPTLVVSGRVAKLADSLAVVHGWTSLPMPQSDRVTELLAGGPLGPLVDLDQPIDLAVAAAGKGMAMSGQVAVSAALRDPESAKATLAERFKLVPGDNGVLLLRDMAHAPHPVDGADEDRSADDDNRHPCELAPAYGAASTRLVCGSDASTLALLGPWLTRTATRAAFASDVHVDVRLEPMKAIVREQKRLLSAILGGLLGGHLGGVMDLGVAVGTDLGDFGLDLDGLSLDLSLSDPGASGTVTFKISGVTSALARVMTANVSRNGPPPASFWQMPGDADFAFFDRGFEASDFARGRDLGLRILSDTLAEDGVKEADRHAIVDAVGNLVSSAPAAYASGLDSDAVRKALAVERAIGDAGDPTQRAEARRAVAEALLGWRLVEVDEPASGHIDSLKALASAWARPGVVAAYRAKWKVPPPALRVAPMPAPLGGSSKTAPLPGAQHFVLDAFLPGLAPSASKPGAKAKAAGVAKPLSVQVVVVPDGARAWFGVGGDLNLVVAKLAQALAAGGDNLGANPELASLKEANVGAAGLATASGISSTVTQWAALLGSDTLVGAEQFDVSQPLPHLGRTPIAFSLTAQAGKPASAVASLRVSKGTIEDAVVTVLRHGGF
jgi:hypothetical protein